MPIIFHTLRYFRLILKGLLDLNMFILQSAQMISLHSEPRKAVSNAFTQAFVFLRQLIFDSLSGLYAS